MLRKEIQGVLKQSLFFLAVVVGISLVIKILFSKHGTYFEVFFLMYQFSLLAFAAFMGLSIFLSDRKQRAEEYVFSLPYSRLRVLGMKLLPRLIALVFFYLLYMALYLSGIEGNVMRDMFFTIWFLFFMGVSFSASADGYMKVGGIALLGLLLFTQLYSFSIKLGAPGGTHQADAWKGNYSLVVFMLLLIPYIISFVFAYKKWGIYSRANYNKGYFKLFIPLIIVDFILSTLFVYTITGLEPLRYYLTSNHQLIVTTAFSTRLLEADEGAKLKYAKGNFVIFFEDKEYVYGTHMTPRYVFIVRIHKRNYTVETLRKGPRPDNWYWGYNYHIRVFRHIIVVPEDYFDPDNRAFVFIDTRSKNIKRMYTSVVLPPGYFEPVIFGADVDPDKGKIFWLIHSQRVNNYPIIKLQEDGKREILCKTRFTPLYLNRMLLTSTYKEFVFSRIRGDRLEVLHKREHISPGWYCLYNPIDLNPTPFKEIYCVGWTGGERNYFRMNAETFEFSRINRIFGKPLDLIWTTSNEVYHVEYETRCENDIIIEKWSYLNKIYHLEGDRFTLLKEFPFYYEKKHKGDCFYIWNNSMIIRYNNRHSFYTLPDMKQLEFPGVR